MPKREGEIQHRSGYFTKGLYLRSQPEAEVERRIGYRPGRLRQGWWLMFLIEMPTVDQFEYRGYSHLSDGKIEGHLPQNRHAPTTEDRLRASGANLTGTPYQVRGLKQNTIAGVFRLAGPERIAKVLPVAPAQGDPNIPDYPPGNGFPQFALTQPLRWVAAAFVSPGQAYLGAYN